MIKVLIVEDAHVVAEAHAQYVARVPGFVVVGRADSGVEALRRLIRDSVDLVLLDIQLPDMTGLDVLRRMRSTGLTTDVIVVTRARDLAVVRTSVSYGAVQYLVKPFTFNALKLKLERYRAYRDDAAEAGTIAAQHEIDDLLAALHHEPGGTSLPKGISRESLDAVVRALRSCRRGVGLSAAEVGRELGASRVTARRYLEYLAAAGLALRRARYGGTGRPELEYRWRLPTTM